MTTFATGSLGITSRVAFRRKGIRSVGGIGAGALWSAIILLAAVRRAARASEACFFMFVMVTV